MFQCCAAALFTAAVAAAATTTEYFLFRLLPRRQRCFLCPSSWSRVKEFLHRYIVICLFRLYCIECFSCSCIALLLLCLFCWFVTIFRCRWFEIESCLYVRCGPCSILAFCCCRWWCRFPPCCHLQFMNSRSPSFAVVCLLLQLHPVTLCVHQQVSILPVFKDDSQCLL